MSRPVRETTGYIKTKANLLSAPSSSPVRTDLLLPIRRVLVTHRFLRRGTIFRLACGSLTLNIYTKPTA
jgi:hypothetical protein